MGNSSGQFWTSLAFNGSRFVRVYSATNQLFKRRDDGFDFRLEDFTMDNNDQLCMHVQSNRQCAGLLDETPHGSCLRLDIANKSKISVKKLLFSLISSQQSLGWWCEKLGY